MELIRFEDFSFTYQGHGIRALNSVNLIINKGEFVTLFGSSGSGKSTLLRHIKPLISPEGHKTGSILFYGKDINTFSNAEIATKIGFVFQNPDNGIVTDKVWHELAFGLENSGLPNEEIGIKVAEIASYFGMDNWFNKNVNELSGGQKQILNLASAMVMQPEILVLDEPTAQLDPIAAQDFLATLYKINRELGITVIISEHRLEDLFSYSDRVVALESGNIVSISAPDSLSSDVLDSSLWFGLPTSIKVAGSVETKGSLPVNIRQGREWLTEYINNTPINNLGISENIISNDTVLSVKNLSYSYSNNNDVIKSCNLEIKESEIYAVLGGNGSGKSTLLSLICGIYKPLSGKVVVRNDKKIVMLPQNPQSLFVKNTVIEELCDVGDKNTAIEIANLCGIIELLDRHPNDLSGGEQQKTALAKVLLTNPDILLLDEPTKGFDSLFKNEFSEIIYKLKNEGKTIVIVSHDVEFCAEYADRCGLLFDGKIISQSSAKQFFNGKSYYTTAANRMSRGLVDNVVTCNDLIYVCNGKTKNISSNKKSYNDNKPVVTKEKSNNIKHAYFSYLTVALMILTVTCGMLFLDQNNFYLVSCLLVVEAFLPFLFIFDKRKPRARELVLLSVLCAIAVAGRAALYMLPQFKPIVAIVIISGVCFGGETGFLVGIVSAFVSNFFMGQGPWTPWQMFALGLVGFLAGILFNLGIVKKSKLSLTIYGALASILIYGVIMNTATVIMTANTINIKLLKAALISGFPFDIIHAFATTVFLWFASEPFINKLERIKKKYKILI